MRAQLPTIHDGAPAAIHTAAGGAVYVSPHPEPERAAVYFLTRLGGVSQPPYDELNVSIKVGDEPETVGENIGIIRRAMGERPSAWVRQVAGDSIVEVSEGGFAGEADALLTSEPDLCLNVAVADCVPVALVGDDEVAMAHSGWRGTLSGISGKTARRMTGRVRAYIGPCIRPCCYEVSQELAEDFAQEFGPGVVSGRQLSLPDAIREDLGRAGAEVVDLGLCTGCRPDLFFSHRKQKPVTGRSLASVYKAGR